MSMLDKQFPIEQRVWMELSNTDVSQWVEKKQNLSYLSWAHAYSLLCRHFPANSYEFFETWLPDNTVMVECRLVIRDGDESMTRMGWLPVLDYKNRAVINPDAFAINTARMRCLTKTISLATGLGMGLYAGSDLPVAEVLIKDEPIDAIQVKSLENMIAVTNTDLDRFLSAYKIDALTSMKKSRFDHAVETLNRKHQRQVEEAENGTAN